MKKKFIAALLIAATLTTALWPQIGLADTLPETAPSTTPDPLPSTVPNSPLITDVQKIITLGAETEPTLIELASSHKVTTYEVRTIQSTCYREEFSESRQVCNSEGYCYDLPIYHHAPYPCTETVEVPTGEAIDYHVRHKVKLEVRVLGAIGDQTAALALNLTNGRFHYNLEQPLGQPHETLIVNARFKKLSDKTIPPTGEETLATVETESTLVVTLIEREALLAFFQNAITTASVTKKGRVSFTLKDYLPLGLPQQFFKIYLQVQRRPLIRSRLHVFPVVEARRRLLGEWSTRDGLTYQRELTEASERLGGNKIGMRPRMTIAIRLEFNLDELGGSLTGNSDIGSDFKLNVRSKRE